MVHDGQWPLEMGNPENYIDNSIKEFIKDAVSFKDGIAAALKDETIYTIFLTRLNYALLLEPEKSEIVILDTQIKRLPSYNCRDDLGQIHTDTHDSSIDLLKDVDELERRANAFYANKKVHSSVEIGTPQPLRDRIQNFLEQNNVVPSYSVNDVYSALNTLNKQELEAGLIARMLYLAFQMSDTTSNSKVEHIAKITG
jgi:hypothetical protein